MAIVRVKTGYNRKRVVAEGPKKGLFEFKQALRKEFYFFTSVDCFAS